jgi:hypothetical protein
MKITKLLCLLPMACFSCAGWASGPYTLTPPTYDLFVEVGANCGGLGNIANCYMNSSVTGKGYEVGLGELANGATATRQKNAILFPPNPPSIFFPPYTHIMTNREGGTWEGDNSDGNDANVLCSAWVHAQNPVAVGQSSGSTSFGGLVSGCWYSISINNSTAFFKREGSYLYTSTKYEYQFISPGTVKWVDNDIPCNVGTTDGATGAIYLNLVDTTKAVILEGIQFPLFQLNFQMVQEIGREGGSAFPIPLNFLYRDGNVALPLFTPNNVAPQFTCSGSN